MAKSFVPVVCIIGLMIVPAWAAQKPVAPSVSRPVVKDGGGSPDKPASETKIGGQDGVQPQSGPQKPAPGIQDTKRAGKPKGPNGKGAVQDAGIGQAVHRATKTKSSLTRKSEATEDNIVGKMRRSKRTEVKDAHDKYANTEVQQRKAGSTPPVRPLGSGLLDGSTGFNQASPVGAGTPVSAPSAPRGNIIK